MDNTEIIKQIQAIIKEGYCQKQSRFLKSWRKRWLVLTNNLLLTYKERRVYQSPTEMIQIKEIMSVKTADQSDTKHSFNIQTKESVFYFSCESALQKQQWIGSIGKTIVKSNNENYDD